MYYHVIVELGAKYHKDVWDQLEIKSDISSLEDIKLRSCIHKHKFLNN